MSAAAGNRVPHDVDVHVGGRVRLRRRILAMSQEKLADAVGLTFQQIQKYERGSNRISASKLFEIARALRSPIVYFFEGLATADAPVGTITSDEAIRNLLETVEGLELAARFPKLGSGKVRRRFLDLVRSLADEETE